MPPKPHAKKPRKPLTALQRKQQKRKYDLIHKAQVKSEYYKELNKNTNDSTPDYVKEIFGAERTIDKDGNVVELKRNQDEEQEQEFDLDKSSSDEEDNEDDEDDKDDEGSDSGEKSRKMQRSAKSLKPNPFKAQLEEREKLKKESLNEREERQMKYKQEKKARISYYKERSQQRSKMLARTKKGQPKMASQMDVLLEKIQKNMD
ncbi:hypothetical protein BD408DRAFT_425390 [Parasitella parasitica]|nr:hypothetical protein BD408DRAFT_425390 [Parasitella parasitica]